MATTILPQDRPIHPPDYHPVMLEVHALALELCDAEGYTYPYAVVEAARDLPLCRFYAEQWDRMAFMAGNDAACRF